VVTPAHVLIVDDERALLPLLERYLRKQGFEPVCFSDPVAALETFRAGEKKFQILMTDLTLEGLSGEELALQVMALDPEIRVVVMSGYPYSTEHFPPADQPRVTFLQKPFLPSQIREAVEKMTAPAPAAEPEAPAEGEPVSYVLPEPQSSE
jgi:DNA-binding NtrC family response regulator